MEGEVSSFGDKFVAGLKEALDDAVASMTSPKVSDAKGDSTSDSVAPLASSSSHKRKLEDDDESSVQVANKPYKQDSSDITSEGDMPSYT